MKRKILISVNPEHVDNIISGVKSLGYKTLSNFDLVATKQTNVAFIIMNSKFVNYEI